MTRNRLSIPPEQLPLWEDRGNYLHTVNVASVPQRSVFRYPGGKTWLVPYIRLWLTILPGQSRLFIEPFAGGGIVGLNVAFEGLADHVIFVELDSEVASVWHTVLGEDSLWLAEQIARFELTPKSVNAELGRAAPTLREKAFQTIVKNRVNRGGILAAGAGRVKYGEGGKGLTSRWYPNTLRKRILDIVKIKERLTFIEGDGLQIIRQYALYDDATFFIDPPYTVGGKRAGRRLYTHANLDHEALFGLVSTLRGNFLMTYDDTDEVRLLAQKYGLSMQTITMKSTHHTEMTELLISRNFDWLKARP